MSDEKGVLRDLSSWLEAHESGLTARGYQVEYTESPEDRPKKSASLMISTEQRVGQLILWETGEAELGLGDISTPEISQQHREITSHSNLVDATQELIDWLGGGLS